MTGDDLLRLLRRLQAEGVEYILVGGHAVRLNGFVRATEDVDLLLPSSVENGRRLIRALDFLASSRELDPAWFSVPPGEPENIRVQDDLQIDLLFAANGQTYETLQPHVQEVVVEGVKVRTLDIDGLMLTKTAYREKDQIDRKVLQMIKSQAAQLRDIPMKRVASSAIDALGIDERKRMLVVVFKDRATRYGYPNLSDEEIRGLIAVMENDESVGHYVATVIKPAHDHERVQF